EAIVHRCPDAVRQDLARVTYAVFEAERSLSKYSRSRPPRRGAQWKPGGCRRNRSPHRASASPEIAASSLPAEKMSCRSEIMTPHPARHSTKKGPAAGATGQSVYVQAKPAGRNQASRRPTQRSGPGGRTRGIERTWAG